MDLKLDISEKLLSLIRIGNVKEVENLFQTLCAEGELLKNYRLMYAIDAPTTRLLEHHKKYVRTDLVAALLLNALHNQDKLFLCAWKHGLNQTLSVNDKRKYAGAICGVAVKHHNFELYKIACMILNEFFEPHRVCRCMTVNQVVGANRQQQRRYH